MSNVLAFQHKRLVRAAELSERHMSRDVRIGAVEGSLVGLVHSSIRVDVVLVVGGARAIFPLAHDAHVEVGPKSQETR